MHPYRPFAASMRRASLLLFLLFFHRFPSPPPPPALPPPAVATLPPLASPSPVVATLPPLASPPSIYLSLIPRICQLYLQSKHRNCRNRRTRPRPDAPAACIDSTSNSGRRGAAEMEALCADTHWTINNDDHRQPVCPLRAAARRRTTGTASGSYAASRYQAVRVAALPDHLARVRGRQALQLRLLRQQGRYECLQGMVYCVCPHRGW
jgi:hypothetical protein